MTCRVKITMMASVLNQCRHNGHRLAACFPVATKRSASQKVTVKSDEIGTFQPPNLVMFGIEEKKMKEKRNREVQFIPEDIRVVRHVKSCPHHRKPPLILLDSFNEIDYSPEEAVELHPDIFFDNPRIDYLYLCKQWQSKYREVDYSWKPTRADMGRGKRKPWPQKGTGRARHGSSVAPQWKGGGVAHGPRGPRPLYRQILPHVRVKALTSALTIKHLQQDLTIVKNFSIPESEAGNDHFQQVLATRNMEEESMLLVHCNEEDVNQSHTISKSVERRQKVNLMPLVGMNVWSLLHHDKLVMTLKALEELEAKVIWHLQRYNLIGKPHNFYRDLPFPVKRGIEQ